MRRFNKFCFWSVFVLLLLFLSSCAGQQGQTIELMPFIGGSDGIAITKIDMRKEVFDGGDDPFDIVVQLQNKGETLVRQQDAVIKIAGIRPQEFNKVEADLTKRPTEDLIERRKDAVGAVSSSPTIFVDFKDLNHVTSIQGASFTFPIQAEVCYVYSTKAVTKVCGRQNLVSPAPGGLCEINEAKPFFNSGAPVHVEDVKENARGSDKVGFSFNIRHIGNGRVWELQSGCDAERKRNKVFVRVDSGMNGLSCTGLTTNGRVAEGAVTLFDGVKTISCTQEMPQRIDFEQPVNVELQYQYQDSATAELVVKHTEE